MTSGIYTITNLITGKQYIGSSANIEKRFIAHKNTLCEKSHGNYALEADWKKYGKSNFEFSIIYRCSPIKHILLFYENLWIDFYGIENLYNMKPISSLYLNYDKLLKHHEKISFVMKYQKIQRINMNGDVLAIYNSVYDASKNTKIGTNIIVKSITNRTFVKRTLFIIST